MIRILFSLAIILFSTIPSFAQLDLSNFTATGRGGVATTFSNDYQTIGINPANLGVVRNFRDPILTLGFSETSFTMRAEALSRKELFESIFTAPKNKQSLSYDEKEDLALRYTGKGFSVNMDAMLFGASVHLPKNIGIAVSIRDRVQLYTALGPQAANLAFLGANSGYFSHLLLSDGRIIDNPRYPFVEGVKSENTLSEGEQSSVVQGVFIDTSLVQTSRQLMSGSRISASWLREYNFNIGMKVYDSYNFSMYLGAGVKVIRGILLLDIDVPNNLGDDFNENALAIAEGLINFDNFSLQDNITFGDVAFPKGAATGIGYDFGMTMVIKRNFYLGAAVTNIGKITPAPDGFYRVEGTNKIPQFSGHGIDNFSILNSNQNSFAFGGDLSPVSWNNIPENEVEKIELPTTLRVGASYDYLKTVHVGVDVIYPLKKVAGNLDGPLLGVGGDFRIAKLFRISSGTNVILDNEKRLNLPLGVTYTSRKGTYEAGIATKDILTYFRGDIGSTFSVAGGFLRFRIGAVGEN